MGWALAWLLLLLVVVVLLLVVVVLLLRQQRITTGALMSCLCRSMLCRIMCHRQQQQQRKWRCQQVSQETAAAQRDPEQGRRHFRVCSSNSSSGSVRHGATVCLHL
jgi:hypothetical protein